MPAYKLNISKFISDFKSKNISVFHYIFIATLLIVICFVGYSIRLKIMYMKRDNNLAHLDKLNANNKNKYQKFVAQQAVKNLQIDKSDKSVEKSTLKARGEHNLSIYFVGSEQISKTQLEMLRNRFIDKKRKFALPYIQTYLTKEAKKYHVNDFKLNIQYKPAQTIPDLVKVGDMMNVWDKNPFAAVKLQDQFEKLVDKSDDSLKIFIYFDNSLQNNSKKDYSFYDFKKFRSFTMPEKKRAYINVFSFDDVLVPYFTQVTIHELFHLFGANDKYIESSTSKCVPDYDDPVLQSLVPDINADIMCLLRHGWDGQPHTALIVQGNLIVKAKTAKEIGWID